MKNRTVMLALAVGMCASLAFGMLDVGVQIASPTGSESPGSIPVTLLLANSGDVAATVPRVDVKISPSGFEAFRENVLVRIGGSVPLSLGMWNYAGGIETCTAWITYPDDSNHTNDTAVVVVGGGGVEDRSARGLCAATSMALSPNPLAGNVLHIEYSLNQAGSARVTLSDIMGRVVITRGIAGNRQGEFSLDLRMLRGGVYIVRLDDGRSTVTRKLVVER